MLDERDSDTNHGEQIKCLKRKHSNARSMLKNWGSGTNCG